MLSFHLSGWWWWWWGYRMMAQYGLRFSAPTGVSCVILYLTYLASFSANRDSKKRIYKMRRLKLPFQIHGSHSNDKDFFDICIYNLVVGKDLHIQKTKLLFCRARVGSSRVTGREQDANLYDPQREKHVLNQSAVTLHRKCIIKDFISSSDDDEKKQYSGGRENNSWGNFLFVYSVCSHRTVGTLVRRHIRWLQC